MLLKKMKKFLFFLVLVMAGCTSLIKNQNKLESVVNDSFDTSCIGPESAKSFFIYLHGIDSNPPSKQELHNRLILEKIALKNNIRIGLPRANEFCPGKNDLYCWGWNFDQKELTQIVPFIIESRKTCFAEDVPFGLIGFSNGGYLLTKLYSHEIAYLKKFKPTLLIASGSAKGTAPVADLTSNPPLVLVIGKKDQFNYEPKETFFHSLQKSHANVQLVEFEGGHTLDFDSLIKALNY